ncbi:hypothetical protein GGS20DRAFT_553731 [Poronia punctata]|nr:hypothetical protein GGS20DRAFT_553731 [Poronia punctata]
MMELDGRDPRCHLFPSHPQRRVVLQALEISAYVVGPKDGKSFEKLTSHLDPKPFALPRLLHIVLSSRIAYWCTYHTLQTLCPSVRRSRTSHVFPQSPAWRTTVCHIVKANVDGVSKISWELSNRWYIILLTSINEYGINMQQLRLGSGGVGIGNLDVHEASTTSQPLTMHLDEKGDRDASTSEFMVFGLLLRLDSSVPGRSQHLCARQSSTR